MTSLKINYHKSEVVALGVNEETERSIASMLNYEVGRIPMKYFGVPKCDKRLRAGVFNNIVDKMRRKLQPWKGKNLTSTGRLILTNTSLSSMPIYMMRMFHLYEGNHHQMDTIRSKFFWGGVMKNNSNPHG
jgi:hypothetical protein